MAPRDDRSNPPAPLVGLHPRYKHGASAASVIRKHLAAQSPRDDEDAPPPAPSNPIRR